MRRVLLFALLFSQWVEATPHDPPMLLAPPQDTTKGGDDPYAVYSTVLAHPVWDHPDNDPILLISQSTGSTYGGMDPKGCIQAPAEYQTRLAEALADYASRKTVKEQLRRDFI
jgi:hypothetical protein